MDLAPLLAEAPPIPLHAIVAMAALVVGEHCSSPKGTRRHVSIGRAWVLALGFVAASGLFIHELRVVGPFSPILRPPSDHGAWDAER